jgi:hypothetical protein
MFAHTLGHILSFDWVTTFRNYHPLWTDYLSETLSGLTVATIVATYVELRLRWYRKHLRIGANWTWEGLARNDPSHILLHPNVSIVSHKNAPKLIVHSVWVRQRKNISNTGQIYGHLDLTQAAPPIPIDKRTTGGDPLFFEGPRIKSKNLTVEVSKVMHCPIWIQTSDNQWFKAQSPGNVSSNWLSLLPWRKNKPVIDNNGKEVNGIEATLNSIWRG